MLGVDHHTPSERRDDATVHFRPQRRRYTPPSALMTLSRFAPMIDLSFLLLIFFMTTTRFAFPEGLLSADMPTEAGVREGPAVALPFNPVIVRLGRGAAPGALSITVDRVERTLANFVELGEVLRRVQAEPGFGPETPVVIVADDELAWDHVVGCWNVAVSAGCRRVAFGEP
ncbi:MAG: biopolymer transporter ExbD [Planctomycetes bacterium]|nr:biopolymer transporter ExbD [Planctomycetota bacterium]